MENIETITRKLQKLSQEELREVADFVDSLLAPTGDEADFEQALDETFGIWRDEVDGIEYEDRLRRPWQQRS